MPPAVGVGVAAIIIRDNKMLLLKRKGAHGEGKWSAPGGWVEKGETFLEATVREVKEECGIYVEAQFDVGFTENIHPEGVQDICIMVLCYSDFEGEPEIMEPEKASAMGWFSMEEIGCKLDLFAPLKKFFDSGELAFCFEHQTE